MEETIVSLKKRINMQAAHIALLNEEKYRDISKHSEEWQQRFYEIRKDILEWFARDRQFVKDGINPVIFYGRRTGKEDRINVVIFNTVEDYTIERAGKGGFISYQAVRIKSDIRDKKRVRSSVKKSNIEEEEKKSKDKNVLKSENVFSPENVNITSDEYDYLIEHLYYAAGKIEEYFLLSKAGQKAKSNVYTYYLIKIGLFLLKETHIKELCQKFTFINKDAVFYFYYENKEKITQKIFAAYTGTRTTKFSVMTKKIKDFYCEKS